MNRSWCRRCASFRLPTEKARLCLQRRNSTPVNPACLEAALLPHGQHRSLRCDIHRRSANPSKAPPSIPTAWPGKLGLIRHACATETVRVRLDRAVCQPPLLLACRSCLYGLHRSRSQKHTHVRTRIHPHARTHARTHARARTYARARAHKHAHATHAPPHTARPHARLSRACTRSHKGIRAAAPSPSAGR